MKMRRNILTGRRPTKKRGYKGGKRAVHGSALPSVFVFPRLITNHNMDYHL